jgi:hypothetical protein
MIVLFFFLCIVLGLAIAPILVVYFRKKNEKRISRLKDIATVIEVTRLEIASEDDKETRLTMYKGTLNLIHEAQDLYEAIQKTPDIYSKRLAKIPYDYIQNFYYAGNQQ